jgi:hypothetical protein
MKTLLIPAFAAVLGLASVPVFAKEVQMNDQERTELRQRTDNIKQQGLLGRTVVSSDAHAVQHQPATKTKTKAKKSSVKKTKHKTKHKAQHAKRHVSKKTT